MAQKVLQAESTPRAGWFAGKAWRVGVLLAVGVAGVVKACAMPRIPQNPAYHQFVDVRTLLGVPNAFNVLSNAAFAVVGLAGLRLLVRGGAQLQDRRERWPWLVFFLGVALTSVGSAWYHLNPSNDSLVWDRLPMAIGFMGLLTALICERIDRRAGLWLLVPLVLLGLGSVLYWYFTELAGAGDLRPYYLVQFYPLVAIPLILVLFPSAYTGTAAYAVALGGYLIAKVVEVEDGPVLQLGGLVSGHTLKHLLAAAGIGALVWMLEHRRALLR
jgi:hypothetical protein